jgi:hypothetical protein
MARANGKPKDRANGTKPGYQRGKKVLSVTGVMKALEASGFVYSLAGQALGVTRQAVRQFVDRHEELKARIEEAEEDLRDIARMHIRMAIIAGDMTTIRWWAPLKMLQPAGCRHGHQRQAGRVRRIRHQPARGRRANPDTM